MTGNKAGERTNFAKGQYALKFDQIIEAPKNLQAPLSIPHICHPRRLCKSFKVRFFSQAVCNFTHNLRYFVAKQFLLQIYTLLSVNFSGLEILQI